MGHADRVAQAATRPSDVVAIGYQVPVEAPTGDVQVLCLGAADLPVPSLIGTARFVHMRLAAINRLDASPWVFDARDQFLQLSDGTTLTPHFAETSTGHGPARITLRRGDRGYLDLFFRVADQEYPPWTAFNWLIRRGQGVIVATTTFERLPAAESEYRHYRPSQYFGGDLLVGPLWCAPYWGSWGWLRPYSSYRRHWYTRRHDGYDLHDGGSLWRYHREKTVGSHWRARRPQHESHIAPLIADTYRKSPHGEGLGWRWQVERISPRQLEGAGSGAARVWRHSSHEQPLSAGQSDSSFRLWSPSYSAPSRSTSTSSSGSGSSTPAPSHSPSMDTVGRRWRSRR